MIRVLILASSPAERSRLEKRVSSNASLRVVGGPSDSLRSAAASISEWRPDVVLAEFESHDEESVAALAGDAKGTPATLLVRGPLPSWQDAAAELGAITVLPINASALQLCAAIEAIAAGLVVFYPGEFGFGPDRINRSLPETLTVPELEVLRLVADGLSNKEIATRLRISEHTVKFHVASVMGKLGAESRTEAVTIGIRRGIVLI
jgi:NarL family two-component system response regulator YdfI